MSGNIHTNKIVIDIQTLNWRRGYYYSCEVLSSRGCAFVVPSLDSLGVEQPFGFARGGL